MKLIVGLGNPGSKYAGHRHNVGYMAVDRIAGDHGFRAWRAKFQGVVTDGRIDGSRAMLLKPETYMNHSGQSVGDAMRFFKSRPEDVIVMHDELDLDPGKIRAKIGGGTAGHRGLRSVQMHVGGAFARIRIGIGHPGRKELVNPYVLREFHRDDAAWLEDLLAAVSRSARHLATGDLQRFSTEVALHRTLTGPEAGAATRQSAEERPPEDGGLLRRIARRFAS